MIGKIKFNKFTFRAIFLLIGFLIFLVIISILSDEAKAANPENNDLDLVSYGDDVELFAGRQYTWVATVNDTDGATNIENVTLYLDYTGGTGSNQSIVWNETSDTFSTSSTYFTLLSDSSDSYAVGYNWTLNFTIQFDWNWASVDDPSTLADDRLNVTDDDGNFDIDDYTDQSWKCENDLRVFSMVFDCDDNWESTTGTITDSDWVRGSTLVTASGNITYEDTMNEYPPVALNIRAQLWTDGTDRGGTYQDDIDASGAFSIPVFTVTGTTDSDYDYDIEIENIPTGGSHNTANDPEDFINSGVDATDPSITQGDWSESSNYLYVDTNSDITDNQIYYSNKMSSGQTGTIRIWPSDSDTSIARVQFSTEVGSSPADATGSPYTGDYDFDSGDTTTGDLTIIVIDLVGNTYTDSTTWTFTRDVAGPNILTSSVTDSSDYIYTTGMTIYYGNDMPGDQTFTVQGTTSDSGAGLVSAVFDATAFGSPMPDNSPGSWNRDYTDVYSDDTWEGSFNVNITDNVGNWNNATYTVVRDILNPSFTDRMSNYQETGDTGSVYANTSLNTFYFSSSVSSADVTFTATGSDSGGAGLRGIDFGSWDGDNPSEDTGAPYNGTYTVTSSDSSGTISVTIYDNVGNSFSVNINVHKDSSTPAIEYSYPTSGGNTSWYISDPGAVIDINFTWEGGNDAPLDYAQYRIGSDPWVDIFTADISFNYYTNWSILWANLDEGMNNISIRVFDCVGHELNHTYSLNTIGFSFLKDTSVPTITYNSPIAGGNTIWYSNSPGNIINIDFGTVGISPLVQAQYRIGSGGWINIFNTEVGSGYTTNWGVQWSSLSEGSNQISIRVFNKAGASLTHSYSASTAGFMINKDTIEPGIGYNGPVAGGSIGWYSSDPGNIIDINFTWLGNSPMVNASYKIGNGGWIDIFSSEQSSDFTTKWGVSWILLAEGENEIHIRVIDIAGNINKDTFTLDSAGFIFKKDISPPEPVSFTIDSNAEHTDSTSVLLTISASDIGSGIYQMRISNDGTFDTESWEDYSTSKIWSLTTGDGTKTVYIMYRDFALLENVTIINDTIILDTTAPNVIEWTLTPTDINEDCEGDLNITVKITDGTLGSGVLNVKINYSIGNSIKSDGYEAMEYIGNGSWRFVLTPGDFSTTWDNLQNKNIKYDLRIEDNLGNFNFSTERSMLINPINDAPVISGAPDEQQVTAGSNHTLDLSEIISDVDNLDSELTLITDSDYISVNGLVITLNYPATVTSEKVTITVSDGSKSDTWEIQVTVNIPKVIKTISKGPVTGRILIVINGDATIDTNAQAPGAPPANMSNLLTFEITITPTTSDWDWLYLRVDFTELDTTKINNSTLNLYYWDNSSNSWVLVDNNGLNIQNRFVFGNVTEINTYAILGKNKVGMDEDSDGLLDSWENQYFGGIDVYDQFDDPDEDGYENGLEYLADTDPIIDTDFVEDFDNDDMDDTWEWQYFESLDQGPNDDPDGDEHTNLDEFQKDTNPTDETDYFKKEEAKKDEDGNMFGIYAGIVAVIVIIVILLLGFMMRSGRKEDEDDEKVGPKIVREIEGDDLEGELEAEVEGETGEFAEDFDAEEERVDEDEYEYEDEEEVEDEFEDEDFGPGEDFDELEAETEIEPVELDTIKPEVRTIETEARMEIIEMGIVHPCTICQGVMPVGERAFQCTCGLISHKDCVSNLGTCPQCGKELEIEGLIPKKPETKKKPMIHREVKKEVIEREPPQEGFFVFLPEETDEEVLSGFIGEYLNNNSMGELQTMEGMDEVRLLISIDCAQQMIEHCYEKGREKEVMGLMIGQTFQYKGETYSSVKDVVSSELDATEVNVRFDSFDELFDQLDQLTYDYQIIGWYHSHPDYSSFMSPTDVDTQARMFKLPHQFAVVIDPIRFDMNAFVLNQNNKKKVIEKPFAIVEIEK